MGLSRHNTQQSILYLYCIGITDVKQLNLHVMGDFKIKLETTDFADVFQSTGIILLDEYLLDSDKFHKPSPSVRESNWSNTQVEEHTN